MTIREVIAAVRALSVPMGYKITCSWSAEWKEFTVRTWKDGSEVGSYFTNDGLDAVYTASAIARDLSGGMWPIDISQGGDFDGTLDLNEAAAMPAHAYKFRKIAVPVHRLVKVRS